MVIDLFSRDSQDCKEDINGNLRFPADPPEDETANLMPSSDIDSIKPA